MGKTRIWNARKLMNQRIGQFGQLIFAAIVGMAVLERNQVLAQQSTDVRWMLVGIDDVDAITREEGVTVRSLVLNGFSPNGFGDMSDDLVLKALTKFKNLEKLRITTNPWCFNGRSLLQVPALKSLRHLVIDVSSDCPGKICLSSDFYNQFATIAPNLTVLEFQGVQLDSVDNLAEFVGRFEGLQFLGCNDCNLHDEHIEWFEALAGLRALDLRQNRFSARVSRDFSERTHCEYFGIGNKEFSPLAALEATRKNASVKVLGLVHDIDDCDFVREVSKTMTPTKTLCYGSLLEEWPDHFIKVR